MNLNSRYYKIAGIVLLIIITAAFFKLRDNQNKRIIQTRDIVQLKSVEKKSMNPLIDKKFYIDTTRDISKLEQQYTAEGKTQDAALINKVAKQPSAIWLVGPSESDLAANKDIATVARTSAEAALQQTIPIYIFYAIPRRDACANYSKGGFLTPAEYSTWVDTIKDTLVGDAVIILEPDALAHTDEINCINPQQRDERYSLLESTVQKLAEHPKVTAVYIDVGNSEWKPNPQELVEPLKKSGIDSARGISVNIASFVATQNTVVWSQRLVRMIGGNKGVAIDTSRNGKGVPDSTVTGTARWCNPSGRGIGQQPTTNVLTPHIDAYIWGKTIGESDGECFGNPPAGVFVPSLALELAKNAQ